MSSSLRKIKTVPEKPGVKKILTDEKKRLRLYLLAGGILLIGLSMAASPKKQESLHQVSAQGITSFSQEPVSVDKKLLGDAGNQKSHDSPLRIVIPAVAIDLPVKEAKVVDGYWEVFPDSANFGLGSAYPDQDGNQVIFAHAREGLFAPLKKVTVGEQIYVFTANKWYTYQVDSIKDVSPSDLSVIGPSDNARLTLYTCSGFSDNQRRIVSAKRVSVSS